MVRSNSSSSMPFLPSLWDEWRRRICLMWRIRKRRSPAHLQLSRRRARQALKDKDRRFRPCEVLYAKNLATPRALLLVRRWALPSIGRMLEANAHSLSDLMPAHAADRERRALSPLKPALLVMQPPFPQAEPRSRT